MTGVHGARWGIMGIDYLRLSVKCEARRVVKFKNPVVDKSRIHDSQRT